MRIGHLSTAYHTALILMGEGWVEKRMEVGAEWLLYPTGPAMVNAFEKGQLDLGYLGLPPTIIGIDRSVPLKCIAGGHVEGTVLIGRRGLKSFEERGSGLEAVLQQLKGGVVGSPSRGSIHDVIIRNYLAQAGLEGEVEVRNFEWADSIPEAMLEGNVDAAVGTPALAVVASRLCDSKILLPPRTLWPNNPSYGIVAREELIEESQGLLESFLRLHEDASNLIRESPREAAGIAARVIELVDEEFVLACYRISPKYCASLSEGYVESTLRFLPILSRLGYIKRPLAQENIFDKRLVEKTHPHPPHYDGPNCLREPTS